MKTHDELTNELSDEKSDKAYLHEFISMLEGDKVKLNEENDKLRQKAVNVLFYKIMTIIGWGLTFYLIFYIQGHSG